MGTYNALVKEIQENVEQLKRENRLDTLMQVTASGHRGPEFSVKSNPAEAEKHR